MVAMLPRFRFGLIALFGLVTAIACGLAVLQYWIRIPMRSGKMYSGLCYEKDWQKLIESRPGESHGDFTMHLFDEVKPTDIFKGFSPTPNLWCQLEIPEVADFNYRALRVDFPSAYMRTRSIDCPVGGRMEKTDFKHDVMDYMGVGGVFRESVLRPKRYTIDCVIAFVTSAPETPNQISGRDIARADKARLRYSGRARPGLMAFSRPINDGLVHLVIVDLR